MLGAIIGDIVGSRWEFNPYIFWWFSEIWLFLHRLIKIDQSFCNILDIARLPVKVAVFLKHRTRHLNNKNKKDFILYCLRLAVPLHKIWIKVKEQK